MEQVITIGAGGSLKGLQHKKGQGIDLTQFGRAEINRASEVLFCGDSQKWYVEFRHAGIYSGKLLTVSMLAAARNTVGTLTKPAGQDRVLFDSYEIAVAAEIDVLNFIRLNEPGALDKAQPAVS